MGALSCRVGLSSGLRLWKARSRPAEPCCFASRGLSTTAPVAYVLMFGAGAAVLAVGVAAVVFC